MRLHTLTLPASLVYSCALLARVVNSGEWGFCLATVAASRTYVKIFLALCTEEPSLVDTNGTYYFVQYSEVSLIITGVAYLTAQACFNRDCGKCPHVPNSGMSIYRSSTACVCQAYKLST